MKQKNASPSKNQVEILRKNGLNRLLWVVVREYNDSVIVRNRFTGVFKAFYK